MTDLDHALAGILLLDKPLGLSSNAALQRVRWLLGRVKAGHAGTLDPLATGMLPLCLGEATRLAGALLHGSKSYRFELHLGERSATGDAEGAIVETLPVPDLGPADITATLSGFLGPQSQTPPMYSAIKRDGQPLYKLARAGVEVERSARSVVIHSLELENWRSPIVQLRVHCSSGTYIRVLAEDIARALGTCGRLASLRRLYVDPFANEAMHTLADFTAWIEAGKPASGLLLPADCAVQGLPALELGAEAEALRHGQELVVEAAPGLYRLYQGLAGPGGAGSGATVFLGLGRVCAPPEEFQNPEGGSNDGRRHPKAGCRLKVERLFSRPLEKISRQRS